MLHVRYELTLDDLVDQNIFRSRHTPSLRLQYIATFVLMPIVVFAVVFIITRDARKTLIDGVFLSIFWLMYFPHAYKAAVRRNLREMVADSGNRASLGERKLTLTDDGILEETSGGSLFWKWGVVDRVMADAEHLYIFGSSFVSHSVPRRAFPNEESYRGFESTVRERMDTAGEDEGPSGNRSGEALGPSGG